MFVIAFNRLSGVSKKEHMSVKWFYKKARLQQFMRHLAFPLASNCQKLQNCLYVSWIFMAQIALFYTIFKFYWTDSLDPAPSSRYPVPGWAKGQFISELPSCLIVQPMSTICIQSFTWFVTTKLPAYQKSSSPAASWLHLRSSNTSLLPLLLVMALTLLLYQIQSSWARSRVCRVTSYHWSNLAITSLMSSKLAGTSIVQRGFVRYNFELCMMSHFVDIHCDF